MFYGDYIDCVTNFVIVQNSVVHNIIVNNVCVMVGDISQVS
jgi:hypothetical protein